MIGYKRSLRFLTRQARAKARSASSRKMTRASILFGRVFAKAMDCRVKPGNDEKM
jgi:hypothetical protein